LSDQLVVDRTAAAVEIGAIVARILVAYGTTEGQTTKIAEYIADVIRGHRNAADAVNIKHSGDTVPVGYDAVIVGASIHMGKHENYVGDFVRQNRATLERLPSALFSVSLAARGDMANAQAYVDNFQQETGWHPAHVGLFAGALLYTQYGVIKRYMMKRIVRDKPGSLSLDTSRDHVYTEWGSVKRFTEDFLKRVVQHDAGTAQS